MDRYELDEYDETESYEYEEQERLDKSLAYKLLANLYYNKAISLENLYRIEEAAKFYDMASNVKFITKEFYYKILRAKAIMYSNDSMEHKALDIYDEIINKLEKDINKLNNETI